MPALIAPALRLILVLLRGLVAAGLAYVAGMMLAGELAAALGYGVMRPAVLAVVFVLTPATFWAAVRGQGARVAVRV